MDSYSTSRNQILALKALQLCGTSSPFYAPCFALHLFIQPCVPFAPGFWILEKCSQQSVGIWTTFRLSGTVANIYWTCCCLLVTWSLRQMIENNFFVVYNITILIAFCLRHYLNQLLVHINVKNSKFGTYGGIKVYRKLQLMILLFNRFHQGLFLPTFLFIVGVSFVIPLFAFITAADTMSVPQIFIFGSAIVQVPLCLAMAFDTFGGIYDDSLNAKQAFHEAIFNLESKFERKIFSKCVRSLSPLRVMIGSVNYFDRLTSMTFVDFCVDILVNLLLLR